MNVMAPGVVGNLPLAVSPCCCTAVTAPTAAAAAAAADLCPPPPKVCAPDQLGCFHPLDRRHHYDSWWRQGAETATKHCTHTGVCLGGGAKRGTLLLLLLLLHGSGPSLNTPWGTHKGADSTLPGDKQHRISTVHLAVSGISPSKPNGSGTYNVYIDVW